MSRFLVELSRENVELARLESAAAAEALGGEARPGTPPPLGGPPLVEVELEDRERARRLGGRLALARRVLEPWAESGPLLLRRLGTAAHGGASAAFRPAGRPRGAPSDPALHEAARAWVGGGGRIDLERPERRFWLVGGAEAGPHILEEIAEVDRAPFEARRMPRLPYRRPVSLPPRLARAAANLARIRPGERVVDPFVGTGALLLEAALLGARVTGVDVDPAMVRGANANLAHLNLSAERLVAADSAEVAEGSGPWDAVVTDPPYGRASTTGGEAASALIARVLPLWAERVRPGGRIVLIVPGGPDPPLPDGWQPRARVADRVHRSLTREFRVYERARPPVSAP